MHDIEIPMYIAMRCDAAAHASPRVEPRQESSTKGLAVRAVDGHASVGVPTRIVGKGGGSAAAG